MEHSPNKIHIRVGKIEKQKSPVQLKFRSTEIDNIGREIDHEKNDFNDDDDELDSLDSPVAAHNNHSMHGLVEISNDELTEEKVFEIIEAKNAEIQNLQILIESLKPIPGMDVSRLKKQMELQGRDSEELDIRDAKILDLAKKNRSITVQWQKERLRAEKSEEYVETILQKYTDLQMTLVKDENADKTQNQTTSSNSEPSDYQSTAELRQQLIEMRRKWLLAKSELKRAQKVISDEVGPLRQGSNDNQDSNEPSTWKGRAQQILLLKGRIQQLEQEAAARSSAVSSMIVEKPVDVKAKRILNEMESERRRAVEDITVDNQQLSADLEEMKHKQNAAKSRIKSLEVQIARLKGHVQTILLKNDDDDGYIAQLQQELTRLKNLPSSASNNREERLVGEGELKIALARLKATNSTQAEEMNRMQEIIVDLRSQLLLAKQA